LFPTIAQCDSKWDSGDETDDVRDVSDLRVVSGDPALLRGQDDVVDEVDNRDQSLRREKEPGEFQRPYEHDAPSQRENCGRGPQHSGAPGQKGRAKDKAQKAASEKNGQELLWPDRLFQRSSKDK